jgi:hypothetical protein
VEPPLTQSVRAGGNLSSQRDVTLTGACPRQHMHFLFTFSALGTSPFSSLLILTRHDAIVIVFDALLRFVQPLTGSCSGESVKALAISLRFIGLTGRILRFGIGTRLSPGAISILYKYILISLILLIPPSPGQLCRPPPSESIEPRSEAT